ncbi:BTB/POZ domain-containing protein KCTD9-like [Pipra filicauda]|uniref:BTB/POZ domain-containing protein KCTD9-like n=1 Tax=Pipra filicauda TaxID=649802 RepID=A0A7R5KAB9_9PASS|nr:BTB/POZ domain-containing protein KCTD9-like [Pipra filicauda]
MKLLNNIPNRIPSQLRITVPPLRRSLSGSCWQHPPSPSCAVSDSCLCQCANLPGVKMLRSSAEGASLKGCDSEDPSGLQANLEGASLKGVAMEGSQMTGITLRVATLRNAKLKNCNLRGATLAGTDWEVVTSRRPI